MFYRGLKRKQFHYGVLLIVRYNIVCIIYAGLHLGGQEGYLPPENRMAPLGYVVCIVTYIILKRFMNHIMSHHM